ncbi:RING/U-box superfamily protein [Rhynchospora pubera]|uniref:RING-type E3 ubiquitin transferase n=1 Tax=Rhynchospora pubera TaxID=906938 RepID=A0AAV8HK87_9POAL|nr:RING/U-box superfamily protein [Rhynchospora pubera]
MEDEGTSYSSTGTTSTSTITHFWCHSCSRVIQPLLEGSDIKCPECQTGFIEEMEGPALSDVPFVGHTRAPPPNFWAPIILSMLRDSYRSNRRSRTLPPPLVPLLSSNETDGMTLVLQGGDGNQVYGISLNDYLRGPNLEMLLQHLLDSDLARHGTPPAQKEAVDAMPRIKIEEIASCPVCLEDFEIGDEAREMPCKHHFHDSCIIPWLEMHSSCPVCRYEMPADEPKEEGSSTGTGQREERGIGNRQTERSQDTGSPRNRRSRLRSLFHWITHRGSSNSSNRTSG